MFANIVVWYGGLSYLSDSHINLPFAESYVRYLAICLVIRLLWLVFFRLKSVDELICARQNRFVTRYIAREQFMWPNIEEILLATFLFLQ